MSVTTFIWLCATSEDHRNAERLSIRLNEDGFKRKQSVFLHPDTNWSLIPSYLFHMENNVVVIIIGGETTWRGYYWHLERLEHLIEDSWQRRNGGVVSIFVRLSPQTPRHIRPPSYFPHFIVNLYEDNGYLHLKRALLRYVEYEEMERKQVPMAAPPPKAAPPFRLIGIFAFVVTIIFALGLIISLLTPPSTVNATSIPVSNLPSPIWGQIGVVMKGLAVASILSLVPNIAAKLVRDENRIKLSVAEILIFMIVLSGIAYDLFKLQGDGTWMLFAAFVVAFLDIGAHLVDWFRESTFRRVDKTWQYKSLRQNTASFDKLYKYERILYAALPLGILIGTFIGIFQKLKEIEIAITSIQAVALSAFLILVLITYKSFKQMIVPMYPLSNPPNQRPVFTSKERDDAKNKEEKTFSLAVMSTDLRKLYLYDSTHNILLMFLFIGSLLLTYNVQIELKYLVLSVLLATLIFSQFPYVLGQYRLHQKVLEAFEGFPRVEVDEKLKKYIPLFPTFHFLAALLSTGTAGGLLFFLIDSFVKGLFK